MQQTNFMNYKEIIKNKKAYFDYEILDTYEAWIELKWYEVKSIRAWQVNLKWSYISFVNKRPVIKWMHVSRLKSLPNREQVEVSRDRNIFLHKKTIEYLFQKQKERWFTIIPLELYFKWSLIKVKVWLCKWRKDYNKKQLLKERSLDKEAKIIASKYIL